MVQRIAYVVIGMVVCMTVVSALADDEQSPRYLRAAIGSIDIGRDVVVEGIYDPARGMRDAQGLYLRGKGYSRFQVKDPVADVVFESMYCLHDSPAFRRLLAARTPGIYRFSGERQRGETKENAVFVERVTFIRPLKEDKPEDKPEDVIVDTEPGYRITILNTASSNRTVLINVVPGTSYDVENLRITLEKQ